MASQNTTSYVELELPSGTPGDIQGVRTLNKTNLLRVQYGERSAHVPIRLFVSKKTDARELLADRGVVITSNADWRHILERVSDVVHFRPEPILESPGWTASYFAQPNGKSYAPRGQPKAEVIFERNREVSASRGSYQRWRDEVAELLTGQHLPMLAVMAGLSSPLLRFSGEKLNFGFEFFGTPGSGKSTILHLMQSTIGRPSSIVDFNSTLAGLEDMFAARSDAPFPVDEANLADGDGRFLKAFAFRMANGTTKVTRHNRVRAQHRFTFATTANAAFYTQLRGFDADTANAAFQRLIPLRVPPVEQGGVFNYLPAGFDNFGALAIALNAAMERQHGTPMRQLLRMLVKTRARSESGLQNQIQDKIRKFGDAVGVTSAAQGRTRASTYFGILYAAGCFAKLVGVLPASWNCLDACVAGYRNYQSQLPAQTPLSARLLTIAKRLETLDLRSTGAARLSATKVERHGAFLWSGVGGRVELLVTDAIKREYFPDWSTISSTADFRTANVRGKDHATAQRTIRRGKGMERFFCFVLPPALGSQL